MINLNEIRTVGEKDNLNWDNKITSIVEAFRYVRKPYTAVEFGVAKGFCAKTILSLILYVEKLYLLDSFKGLPRQWGKNKNQSKGAFKISDKQNPVFLDPKVIILKGRFKKTVKKLCKLEKDIKFVHIDCDIYESTKTALEGIINNFQKVVILFDEFYNYPEYLDHEYKAFWEWAIKYKLNVRGLFKTYGHQVAFEVWK